MEEEYEQAIAEFERAIAIDPTQKDAYAELADLYIELEEYEDAIEILEEGYEETEAKGLSRKIEVVKELSASMETEDADGVTKTEVGNDFTVESDVDKQIPAAETTTGEVAQTVAETASEVGQEAQAAPESSADIYATATSKSKQEVEEFANKVKKLFLEHKWSNLAEMMVYPIEIGGITYSENPDIIKAGFTDKYLESFMEALEAEDCESMYCDSNGIRLGNGEVWIADVDWNGSRQLKIVAINDFCSESSQKKKEENTVVKEQSKQEQPKQEQEKTQEPQQAQEVQQPSTTNVAQTPESMYHDLLNTKLQDFDNGKTNYDIAIYYNLASALSHASSIESTV